MTILTHVAKRESELKQSTTRYMRIHLQTFIQHTPVQVLIIKTKLLAEDVRRAGEVHWITSKNYSSMGLYQGEKRELVHVYCAKCHLSVISNSSFHRREIQ